MIAEMSLAARTLAVIGIVLWPSAVLGQAPSSDGDVWYPTGLSFDRCMQRGEAALRAMGSADVWTHINFTGMGWIGGTIAGYSFRIACITAKDVIVFNVAGPVAAAAHNYTKSIRDGMQGSH